MSTPESNLIQICSDIRQKIDDKSDFMTIEKDIHELCVLFQIKWQNFMNPENVLEQSKPEFIEDSRLVFSLLYNHFGSEEALNEIDECLQEDPDSQPDPDIDEYLIFVENLNMQKQNTPQIGVNYLMKK